MPTTRQTSFSAGELSPRLYGRTDLELFGHGLRLSKNWLINRQGNARTRPGTKWCVNAKTDSTAQIALVPYVGATASYLVEFGAFYCRIYNSTTFALVAELVTTFNDVRSLQWSQVGKSLILVNGYSLPQELIIEASGGPQINPARIGPPGETPSAATSLTPIFPSIDGRIPAMPVLVAWQPLSLFVVDAAHPPREWLWKVSTTVRHRRTGELAETLAETVRYYSEGDPSTGVLTGSAMALPADNMVVLFSDAPVYLAPGYGEGGALSAEWECVAYNYYRGRGEVFGLVGSTTSNALFADFGDEPNYKVPPLSGTNPFLLRSPLVGTIPHYPRAVAHFQQRRVFAGTSLRPSTWWASAVDAWGNFDQPKVSWEGQPLEATLVNRQSESIVAMGQLEQLIVLTDTSVWAIGRATDPLDFSTLPHNVRLIDEVGSLAVQPVVVDGVLLFARNRGHGVRAIVPAGDGGGLSGLDVSWHSEHLFRGVYGSVRSWCFQREPHGTVWAVRTDGQLLSCTRTSSGWAWAQHLSGTEDAERSGVALPALGPTLGGASRYVDGDHFLALACVPESDGDAVFVAVKRQHGVSIERIVGRREEQAERAYPLDSHLVVSAPSNGIDYVVTNLDHLEGRTVWACSTGYAPQGPFVVREGRITLQPWAVSGWPSTVPSAYQPPLTTLAVGIGLPFVCDLETLDAAPGRFNEKNVTRVGFEVETSASMLKVGQDFEHLVEWSRRKVSDSYDYPSAASALVTVNTKGAWAKAGRAVLRQDKPETVLLLGITREYDAGG